MTDRRDHTNLVDPLDRLRSAGKRVTDPLEAFAQRVAERVIDLVVHVLDINALMQQVDLNALLDQVDMNNMLKNIDMNALLQQVDIGALLERVDINEIMQNVDIGALLDRVDVNQILGQVDMEKLVAQTDLGAIIARSTGGIATEALDTARSGAVGLDVTVDRWTTRLLRRQSQGPSAPPALLGAEAQAPAGDTP